MKISIIIPVYNGEEHILNRTKELMPYLDKEAEFIFVNDGSTDRTLELLFGLKKDCKHLDVSVVSYLENKGQLYARKFGVELAKYSDILMTDIDDPFSFSYLEGLKFDLDSKLPDTMITIPKQIFVNGKPNGVVWNIPQYLNPEQYVVSQFVNHSGLVAINNTILKKEMVIKAITEVQKMLEGIGVKRLDYAEDSLTANIMIQEGLVKYIFPSTVYSVPYTLDNQNSISKDRSKTMRDMPVLIANAYYQIFSQYEKEDVELKDRMRNTHEDICKLKYGDDAKKFMQDVDKYVARMVKYYG